MSYSSDYSVFSRTLKIPASLALIAALLLAVGRPGNATAGTITFSLGDPAFNGPVALFNVQLDFEGNSDDRIESIQLSVLGSDVNLLDDLSRFSFELDTSLPFNSWSTVGTLGISGVDLLFPLDPFNGPFVTPGMRQLGVLSVDTAGLPAGSLTNVSLVNAILPTDVGGTFDGSFTSSIVNSAAGTTSLVLEEPGGVGFAVPQSVNPVPEPASLLCFVGLAAICGGSVMQRRRSREASGGVVTQECWAQ